MVILLHRGNRIIFAQRIHLLLTLIVLVSTQIFQKFAQLYLNSQMRFDTFIVQSDKRMPSLVDVLLFKLKYDTQ